jgi:alpha-glucosidase
MKRRIPLYILGSIILLSFIGFGTQWVRQQYALRQMKGSIDTELTAAVYQTGNFTITWHEAGFLSVYNLNNPEKILWQSLPGESFLSAGVGQETVEEARGSFFISDQITQRFSNQTIKAITQTGDMITILGELFPKGGSEGIGYSMRLTEISPEVLQFAITTEDADTNRIYLTYHSTQEEHIFGFGEQFSFFDFKGKRIPIFISEQGVGRGAQPVTIGADITAKSGGKWYSSYAGVPHYITSQIRSLYLENYEFSVFDLRKSDRVQIMVFSNELTGDILYGETPTELITAYTAQNGRMRPLPDWITSGAVIGMQGGTEQVYEVWEALQTNDTPIAGFWLQDWVGQRITSFGKQLWWNWQLDTSRYPDWEQLVSDLSAQDIQTMIYVSPFLTDKSENPAQTRDLFQEAAEQDFLVKNPEGGPYLIQNTDFSAGMIDLTNPDARAWYVDVIREEMIAIGALGWMADFGEALPYDAVLFDGTSAASYHNQYPEEWAKLNREVIDELPNGDDYVFFTRAGFRQSPAYSTLFWEGDQLVSWDEHDGIKTAVTGLLTSGLSGYSFNHSDIGGYTAITNPIANYHRSKELFLRWTELNAFTTVFRTHEGNQPDNNHQFYSDDETLEHFTKFAKIYTAWDFYRQELIAEAAKTGLPVIRHLFIHYPDDPNVYQIQYEQFMVGSEMIIAPVVDEEQARVHVYLPEGKWTHLWSGEQYRADQNGLRIEVDAPIGQPAVFTRTGSEVETTFRENLIAAGILD